MSCAKMTEVIKILSVECWIGWV